MVSTIEGAKQYWKTKIKTSNLQLVLYFYFFDHFHKQVRQPKMTLCDIFRLLLIYLLVPPEQIVCACIDDRVNRTSVKTSEFLINFLRFRK